MSIKKNGNRRRWTNLPAVFTMIFFGALFLCLIVYLGLYVKNNSRELINSSYNSRQQTLLSENTRGSILSRNGEVLAETVTDENGTETRSYPYQNLFAHAVGFSTKGRTGIESQANAYLINTSIPMKEKIANDIAGRKNPGDNCVSTLDVAVQEAAAKALGVYKGAVIVMEPKTGRVLAMVSKPDFDPNQIVQIWDGLAVDKSNTQLLNRAAQGLYPPGSTFKIVTALEYIREHPDSYQQYTYTCNGSFTHAGSTIRCYHGTNHGTVSFRKAFAKSCNSAFANIGVGLDRSQYGETLNGLFFNRELQLPFLSAVSTLRVDDTVSDEDMMQISIGQGYAQITPLQLCMITCGIANGGTVMKPMLVERIEGARGNLVEQYRPETYEKIMTESEAAALAALMRDVVEEGTGSKLSGLSYTAAGKTGSAEYNLIKEDSHAWFTGFAPAEDPQVAVTIIVEGIGSGGDYAVPIARRIFDAYFGITYSGEE